ncbi:3-oxoacyl-reductase [Massarina eburnea CBS 473.64]|uniref:3-oxoacyl-reductase n=1 Tax=Massarina eburnea CBS 473.64 TaxID=1395130 RepID=A0A6A6RYG9_9PLEO|nr:3-oxoacyl-reductase [Massarina eburnea CBS 473.64]
MPTAVVTGANSGIGHALAQLLIKEGYDVIAADITLSTPIKSLGCSAHQLDVTSPPSISSFKNSLGDRAIDLLLNVAGIAEPVEKDNLSAINLETLQKMFAVNTFGPLLVTQALLPNLLKASAPKIAVMSSRMGSISDNGSGGQYAYRASKAGVNAIFKSLAVDLKEKGVVVVVLHPGIVRTGIGGGLVSGSEGVEPADAAKDLWTVLRGKGLQDSGRWWHRSGEELPW